MEGHGSPDWVVEAVDCEEGCRSVPGAWGEAGLLEMDVYRVPVCLVPVFGRGEGWGFDIPYCQGRKVVGLMAFDVYLPALD